MSDVFAYAPIDASQSFSDAIKNIALIPFQFNVYTVPMWYLYMLIGLYLYMPFFSFGVEQATVRQKKIFLMFWSFSLFLPYAYSFFSPNLLGVVLGIHLVHFIILQDSTGIYYLEIILSMM